MANRKKPEQERVVVSKGTTNQGGPATGAKRSRCEVSVNSNRSLFGRETTLVVAKATEEHSATHADFIRTLGAFREVLNTAKVAQNTRKSIEADLQALEDETKKSKPSLLMIEEKLKSIEGTIRRAAGSGSSLVQSAAQLGKLAQFLFGG